MQRLSKLILVAIFSTAVYAQQQGGGQNNGGGNAQQAQPLVANYVECARLNYDAESDTFEVSGEAICLDSGGGEWFLVVDSYHKHALDSDVGLGAGVSLELSGSCSIPGTLNNNGVQQHVQAMSVILRHYHTAGVNPTTVDFFRARSYMTVADLDKPSTLRAGIQNINVAMVQNGDGSKHLAVQSWIYSEAKALGGTWQLQVFNVAANDWEGIGESEGTGLSRSQVLFRGKVEDIPSGQQSQYLNADGAIRVRVKLVDDNGIEFDDPDERLYKPYVGQSGPQG